MEIACIILGIGGLLMLASVWPAWQRQRNRILPEDHSWNGATIDVAPMVQRLERVRSDYAVAVQPLQVSRVFHEQMLSAARRAVSRLSFFSSRRGKPDTEPHANMAAFCNG